jgi:hypothetical protein
VSTPVNPWRPACSARRRSGSDSPSGNRNRKRASVVTHGLPPIATPTERAFARTLGHPFPGSGEPAETVQEGTGWRAPGNRAFTPAGGGRRRPRHTGKRTPAWRGHIA